MEKLLFFLFVSPILCFGQISPKLFCSNIKVDGGDLKFDTTDIHFVGYLEGEGRNAIKFFSNNELSIDAIFKTKTIYSKRSSVKSGSVRVNIVYFIRFGDNFDIRRTERIIYLNDKVDLNFLENFVYVDGAKSKRITLSYKITKQ